MAYRTSMCLATQMLAEGIISRDDYSRIDKIIAKKHGLDLCTICCREPLI